QPTFHSGSAIGVKDESRFVVEEEGVYELHYRIMSEKKNGSPTLFQLFKDCEAIPVSAAPAGSGAHIYEFLKAGDTLSVGTANLGFISTRIQHPYISIRRIEG
ncbi:MAG: hypothetical protein LBQ33_03700, partial [Oscillospiraceae bacterium]|nr:hypothetical protein [Oscillospiraceae bacterium]